MDTPCLLQFSPAGDSMSKKEMNRYTFYGSAQENERIAVLIPAAHTKTRFSYGAKRLQAELAKEGFMWQEIELLVYVERLALAPWQYSTCCFCTKIQKTTGLCLKWACLLLSGQVTKAHRRTKTIATVSSILTPPLFTLTRLSAIALSSLE